MSCERRVRVAQIVRPAAGGIRRHVTSLIAHLDSQQFACELYAPETFTLDECCPEIPRVTLNIAPATSILRDWRAINAAAAAMRSSVDLVHAHGLRAALIGVLAAQRCHVPAVVTVHNLIPPLSQVQRQILNYICSRAYTLIAVSSAVRKSIGDAMLQPRQVVVIPNGISIDEYRSARPYDRSVLGVPDDAPLIAYAGRLSDEKGVAILVDAFKTVTQHNPDSHLLVIGAGPEEERLRNRASALTGVHFLGHRDDVASLFACSDIIAMPSLSEGQGIAALEAMALGKPVIASNAGGLPETVIDGECGIIVKAGDASELAGAVTYLIEDRPLQLAMGASGIARVEHEYALTNMITRIEDIYRLAAQHAA